MQSPGGAPNTGQPGPGQPLNERVARLEFETYHSEFGVLSRLKALEGKSRQEDLPETEPTQQPSIAAGIIVLLIRRVGLLIMLFLAGAGLKSYDERAAKVAWDLIGQLLRSWLIGS